MKNCIYAYYDRWHSEWICSKYDSPVRVCCPCESPKFKDDGIKGGGLF